MARTAYWVIDLASYAAPTNAQIAAGQRTGGVAAAWAGSEAFAATSGSGTIIEATAASGLIAGAEYRLSWTIYDDAAADYPASAPQHYVWAGQLILDWTGEVSMQPSPPGYFTKLYLTSAGQLVGKTTSPDAGDRRVALVAGALVAV